MTVVVNHDTNSVIWCSIGYKKEVLHRFFDGLTPKQRESIRCVSADGARRIADCVKEYCPNAALCIDPFHVVSWATDALDEVRRRAWSEANRIAREAPKRHVGRPKNGVVLSIIVDTFSQKIYKPASIYYSTYSLR